MLLYVLGCIRLLVTRRNRVRSTVIVCNELPITKKRLEVHMYIVRKQSTCNQWPFVMNLEEQTARIRDNWSSKKSTCDQWEFAMNFQQQTGYLSLDLDLWPLIVFVCDELPKNKQVCKEIWGTYDQWPWYLPVIVLAPSLYVGKGTLPKPKTSKN